MSTPPRRAWSRRSSASPTGHAQRPRKSVFALSSPPSQNARGSRLALVLWARFAFAHRHAETARARQHAAAAAGDCQCSHAEHQAEEGDVPIAGAVKRLVTHIARGRVRLVWNQ